MYALRTFAMDNSGIFEIPDGFKVKTVLDYSSHAVRELPNGDMEMAYTITVLIEAVL